MPIEIEVTGVEETMARLDGMIEKLIELRTHKIGEEFANWQTETVHRRAPFVVHHRNVWGTRFRPHSRWEMQRHRRAMRRLVRHGRYTGFYSTRPILRQELLDDLVKRMEEVLSDVRW
jgi:hypothetical protein